MKVTPQGIVEALRSADRQYSDSDLFNLAQKIEAHGIAPPDEWVLVPKEPTQEMIDAGIMFGTSPTKVSIIWSNMLAAEPSSEPSLKLGE